MYKITHDEDLALKQAASLPAEQKPDFAWHQALGTQDHLGLARVRVRHGGEQKSLQIEQIAHLVGSSLTDLHLARSSKREEIFTEGNRGFVAQVAQRIAALLQERLPEGEELLLSENDYYQIVERALIELDAHDVARSLHVRRGAQLHADLMGSAEDDLENFDPDQGVLVDETIRLIRRNNNVVPWSENKIESAVRRAFLALHLDPDPAAQVARAVSGRVRAGNDSFVEIESVQDMVQEELMRQGHFKVAEAYILYRQERKRLRELERESQQHEHVDQDSMVIVQAADGSTRFWDGSELRQRIDYALIGLEVDMSAEQIERELRRSVSTEMSEQDLRKTIVLNSRTLIQRDADFARFSARILLSYIYEECLDWSIERDGIGGLREAHRRGFKKYLKHAIAIERLSPSLLDYDLEELASALDPSADMDFDYLGVQALYDRYLLKDKVSERNRVRCIEPPQFFWMRVAMGLFHKEKTDRERWVKQLYQLYKGRRFCSSTPTLFNSGTLHSQLSSCYLYKVDDSIESIMLRGIAENAFLSKWAGGLGGSWTSVRGTGGYIRGTNGESQGVIPFLKLHNDQLVAVNQGGKRRGSGCAYLEPWHNDIEDFLELRKNTGDERRRTHDMNTANWIPDLFMKRMNAREQWTLFCANEVPDLHELYGSAFEARYIEYEAMAERGEIYGRQIKATELWRKMLKMLFETGHPWITFKDPCNIRSPQDHAGVVHSSNLCTEITLNTSHEETAVCNLGSIVLDSHLKEDGSLDLDLLRESVRIAIRALDNVIDINFYPTEAARRSNLRHRPIGLGVMGLQNALYRRGLRFASQEALEFNDEFMEAIAYFAYEASSDLAKERGSYESYQGSKWDRGLLPHDTIDLLEQERGVAIEVPRGARMDWSVVREKIAQNGMRNSNVIAIAPTATISNIMGTTPCIEPHYKNLYVKENLGGKFMVLNRNLVKDLKARGLWNDQVVEQLRYWDGDLTKIAEIPQELVELHATVFEVPADFIIDAAARRQKWIDQSQSVNLYYAGKSIKELSHMYRRAWSTGLKTTYYLRTLGASQILKAGAQQQGAPAATAAPSVASAAQSAASVGATVAGSNPAATAQTAADKPQFTAEQVQACSLDAMLNGGECEACQ